MTSLSRLKAVALSFSGAGHLLVYHLGVASQLRQLLVRGNDVKTTPGNNYPISDSTLSIDNNVGNVVTPSIAAVSGSSSGAIAATLFALYPNRIEEYVDRFISDRGRALFHLTTMIQEEEMEPRNIFYDISLHIATTKCLDGSLQLFNFSSSSIKSKKDEEYLLNCIQASCKIPSHFHPLDVLPPSLLWGTTKVSSYPESDGILINGISYVDGGISAPAPPIPDLDGIGKVIISPISGRADGTLRISPCDESQRLWPWDIHCRGNFYVKPTAQNLKTMQVAAGVASCNVLMDWYERGIHDGKRFLSS